LPRKVSCCTISVEGKRGGHCSMSVMRSSGQEVKQPVRSRSPGDDAAQGAAGRILPVVESITWGGAPSESSWRK
jgi:hypothetical protein